MSEKTLKPSEAMVERLQQALYRIAHADNLFGEEKAIARQALANDEGK